MKVCSKCNIAKDINCFSKDKSRSDGLSYICKDCRKEIYNKNREIILFNKKEYYLNNRDDKIKKACVHGKIWRKNNPDKVNFYNSTKRQRRLQRNKTKDPRIKAVYSLAKRLTDCLQAEFQVDHIIPMQGKLVSGLHIFENLQVISAKENYKKNNSYMVKI